MFYKYQLSYTFLLFIKCGMYLNVITKFQAIDLEKEKM